MSTSPKKTRSRSANLKSLLTEPSVLSAPAAPKSPDKSRRPYGGEPYLPVDAAARKGMPIVTGVLDYFPLALLEVARVSKGGNDQHNPGEPLHWARGKSMDQADTAVRHIMERGGVDVDGQRHLAKAAWRILADLQIEMERELGRPESRGCSGS